MKVNPDFSLEVSGTAPYEEECTETELTIYEWVYTYFKRNGIHFKKYVSKGY